MSYFFNLLATRINFLNLMSFQAGPALAGLLAALIPLVIHLSRSRRTKKMRFSTTRFFTDQFLRSYRMSRIREVLLLACRMALFALLGFGHRPAAAVHRRPRPPFAAAARAASSWCSTTRPAWATPRTARRCSTAPATPRGRCVEDLRPGDSASVVLAGRRADGPQELFPRPTTRLEDVLQALDGVKPTGLSADLTEAIPRRGGPGPRRHRRGPRSLRLQRSARDELARPAAGGRRRRAGPRSSCRCGRASRCPTSA